MYHAAFVPPPLCGKEKRIGSVINKQLHLLSPVQWPEIDEEPAAACGQPVVYLGAIRSADRNGCSCSTTKCSLLREKTIEGDGYECGEAHFLIQVRRWLAIAPLSDPRAAAAEKKRCGRIPGGRGEGMR